MYGKSCFRIAYSQLLNWTRLELNFCSLLYHIQPLIVGQNAPSIAATQSKRFEWKIEVPESLSGNTINVTTSSNVLLPQVLKGLWFFHLEESLKCSTVSYFSMKNSLKRKSGRLNFHCKAWSWLQICRCNSNSKSIDVWNQELLVRLFKFISETWVVCGHAFNVP